MTDIEVNLHVLDAAYKPFPTFEGWRSQTTIDTVRWDRYISSLEGRTDIGPEILKRAREGAKRAAALDTGAIEGLYEVDRGFTYTVAFETAAWEVALAEKGERVRSLFEAQLHAYDYVLTLATGGESISEAAIRALHQVVCRAQDTYRVMTAVGPQEQPLPKGQYKSLPNHVRTRKGTDHSYAPVDVTPQEMDRLVKALCSDVFLAAHPVIQAAYAHYALVVIHPFADGNGRVVRALASAFTYRAISMPIVILSEQKDPYLDALGEADEGDYQRFVDFMLARSLDTIKLVEESVRSASSQSPEQTLSTISRLYVTKGGYTHDQVDEAGMKLLKLVSEEVQRVISRNSTPKVSGSVQQAVGGGIAPGPAHRLPIGGGVRFLEFTFSTAPPAAARVVRRYNLLLPKDARGDDDIQISLQGGHDIFAARMEEVLPELSGILRIRVTIFAERLVGEMLEELSIKASNAFSGQK
jgi:Fic family protein